VLCSADHFQRPFWNRQYLLLFRDLVSWVNRVPALAKRSACDFPAYLGDRIAITSHRFASIRASHRTVSQQDTC
jgi:hypothetical protein